MAIKNVGKIANKNVTFPSSNNKIVIRLENKSEYEIEKQTWNNIQYRYDKRSKSIKEEIIGTFIQYPLRLAWAITINKSQGLTFKRAIINFGSGTFLSGQAYVALSRVTHFTGLFLTKKMKIQDIKVRGSLIQQLDDFYSIDLKDYLRNHSKNREEYNKTLRIYHHILAWYHHKNKNYLIALRFLVKSYDSKYEEYRKDSLYNLTILGAIKQYEFNKIKHSLTQSSSMLSQNRKWWNSLPDDWKEILLYNLVFDKEKLAVIKKSQLMTHLYRLLKILRY